MSDPTPPFPEAEARRAFLSLSIELERLSEKAKELVSVLGRDWPDAFYNDQRTSLAYWFFCGAEALDTDLSSCLAAARGAATMTEEEVAAAWAERQEREQRR